MIPFVGGVIGIARSGSKGDWLGGDLMECHPCYIVTYKLKQDLEISKFSGVEIFIFELIKDECFDVNYHRDKPLVVFYWMNVKVRGI